MVGPLKPAAPWTIEKWFNTPRPIGLNDLRGRVIMLYAFQMLCPGCVSFALPQAKRIGDTFASNDVAVIGLHTVFEHHAANSPAALKAFLHEYQIRFPVGIDMHAAGKPMPLTMQAYGMQGTPTLIIIDRNGMLRRQVFGHVPDIQLGAEIMAVVGEAATPPHPTDRGTIQNAP